jgi:hypothetical protein
MIDARIILSWQLALLGVGRDLTLVWSKYEKFLLPTFLDAPFASLTSISPSHFHGQNLAGRSSAKWGGWHADGERIEAPVTSKTNLLCAFADLVASSLDMTRDGWEVFLGCLTSIAKYSDTKL